MAATFGHQLPALLLLRTVPSTGWGHPSHPGAWGHGRRSRQRGPTAPGGLPASTPDPGPRGSHLAKIFLAMRVREVLACCFRSVSPGCRRLLPLPLPPALAEPRSTPVAASTSLRNSGSRQSANRTRRSESARAQPERLSPEPRPRPDTAPPGSPVTGGAGHAGCCSGLRAMQRGSHCPHRPWGSRWPRGQACCILGARRQESS